MKVRIHMVDDYGDMVVKCKDGEESLWVETTMGHLPPLGSEFLMDCHTREDLGFILDAFGGSHYMRLKQDTDEGKRVVIPEILVIVKMVYDQEEDMFNIGLDI